MEQVFFVLIVLSQAKFRMKKSLLDRIQMIAGLTI